MKKIMFTLIALLTMAMSANGMSYERAREEALFLTDKMAYELNLSDEQYEAAYEINLDYLMSVTGRNDVHGIYWERRNMDLSYILYSWQWEAFRAASYFFRPLYWEAGLWHFSIYTRYPRRDYFYFGRPHFYASYRGGHSWRLNGNRSYYVTRRDHFRSIPRDTHFGMRDGWDRGDFRGSRTHSSTRITASPSHRDYNDNRHAGTINGTSTHGVFGNSRNTPADRNVGNPRNTPADRNVGNPHNTTTTTQRSTTTTTTTTSRTSGTFRNNSSTSSSSRSSSVSPSRSSSQTRSSSIGNSSSRSSSPRSGGRGSLSSGGRR